MEPSPDLRDAAEELGCTRVSPRALDGCPSWGAVNSCMANRMPSDRISRLEVLILRTCPISLKSNIRTTYSDPCHCLT